MNLSHILLRSQVVKSIRRFFEQSGFTEMITPRLVALPGQEPYLEPMWTTVHDQKGREYPAGLITSPEYAMKRLLAAGLDRIYDLGPCFRDGEPWDGTHDPEFLMLEWYRRDAGLEALLIDTEKMVRYVASSVSESSLKLTEQPFRRLTVKEAMRMYANLDLDEMIDHPDRLREEVLKREYTATVQDSWDDLFFKIFLSEVEPKLGWNDDRTAFQPTFLTHYPVSMAALARKDEQDARYALRTEFYIGDMELANGFAELSDADEQRMRFKEERALRKNLGKKTWSLDERFLEALPAMGNAAGIAFGVDRLVMLIAGTKSISDILPIPVGERLVPKEEK